VLKNYTSCQITFLIWQEDFKNENTDISQRQPSTVILVELQRDLNFVVECEEQQQIEAKLTSTVTLKKQDCSEMFYIITL